MTTRRLKGGGYEMRAFSPPRSVKSMVSMEFWGPTGASPPPPLERKNQNPPPGHISEFLDEMSNLEAPDLPAGEIFNIN